MVITETYDSNVTFSSSVPSPDVGNNQWNIGDLPSVTSGSIDITVNVVPPLDDGTILHNSVQIVSDQGFPDSATEDTHVDVPIIVDPKTDSLYIDADKDGYVSPGDTLTYTAVIENAGNGPDPDFPSHLRWP